MRIFDENNIEIQSPNPEIGFLKPDKLFIRHHEAVEAVEEQFHYEYIEYPNGGKDRKKIIDVEGVEAADAWDEYEDILRYALFSEEELENCFPLGSDVSGINGISYGYSPPPRG